jgi:putative ABC transport system permease protein
MFLRLIYQSFRLQQRRKLMAAVAITLGVAVATATIAIATDIGDKVSEELRSFGANISVVPQEDTLDLTVGGVNIKPASEGAYLNEADLPKIKGIFWRNNIRGFAPLLSTNVQLQSGAASRSVELIGTYFAKTLHYGKDEFVEGVTKTSPWWKVQGEWPADDSERVLVGERLARVTGIVPESTIVLAERNLRVSGILSTGSSEEDAVVAPLSLAQQLAGKPGAVRSVLVSAVTKPEDAFARTDPRTLKGPVYDRWYCSPYALSIAHQIEEVIPNAHAEQIRRVAQNEGKVLNRIQGLMLLITIAALCAAALAVSAAMATAIMERRTEVGLMKAMGANNSAVAALFMTEAGVLALIGGVFGFALGGLLAAQIGRSIFNSSITVQPVLFPIVLAVAFLVTYGGSAASIRRAVRLDPAHVLRGSV